MSADQTLRTAFVWDTASVKQGEKDVVRAYDNIVSADKKAAKQMSGGGHGASRHNLVQGVKDLFEGRTLFGVQRLASQFRKLAIPLGAAATAVYAIGKGLAYIRREMDATARSGERLNSSFNTNSRAGAFSSGATSYSELSGQRAKLEAQLRAGRDQQNALSDTSINMSLVPGTGGLVGSNSLFGDIRRLDFMTGLFGESKTEAQKAREANAVVRGTQSQMRLNTEFRTDRLGREVSIAGATAPSRGEPSKFNQDMQTLRLEEQVTEEKLKQEQATEKDLELNRKIYSYRREILANDRQVELARHDAALAEVAIQGGGGSAFAKSLSSATRSRSLAMGLLDRGGLTEEASRSEELVRDKAISAQRSALMDRYLDPETGKRLRNGVIQREFRNERNATRRRNAFLRRIDRGEFNMDTGRKASIGGESGLSTFDLGSTGGLKTGSLNKADAAHDLLDDIKAILDKRLPQETH